MALLTQSTYSIKRIPKENYRFDISPETISLPSKADGSDTDYSTAKANLKLSYDGKEIYPNYDERLEDEIGGRNLLSHSSDVWESGHILSTDGTNSTISRTRTKGFLSFSPSAEYTFSRGTDLFERCMVFEYGENYNFIEVNSGKGTWMPNSKKFTFTTKANTKYLRFVLDIPFNANNIPNYEIQLEKGNKATDWTPAPEDLDAQINDALIKQNCEATVENGVLSVTGLTANAGYVDIPIDYGVFKQTKRLTLAKSKQGNTGADGKSITLVDVEYGKSANAQTQPTAWTTTAPTLTGNEQLWTRTKTTYSMGDPPYTYTTPANITPKTGADGNSITSITEWYYLSTSKAALTGGSWSNYPWPWVNGKFIWTKTVFTYSKTPNTETLPTVSSEWEAINDLKIGGVNLLLNSKSYGEVRVNQTTPKVVVQEADLSKLTMGEWYMVSFDAKWVSGNNILHCEFNGSAGGNVNINTDGSWKRYSLKSKPTLANLYFWNTNTLGDIYIRNIKIEEGDKATDWSPAPEDVQAEIDELEIGGRNLLPSNIWENGHLLVDSGVDSDVYRDQRLRTFEFIAIENSSHYTLSWDTNSLRTVFVLEFNSEKQWIRTNADVYDYDKTPDPFTFQTHQDSSFLKVVVDSFGIGNINPSEFPALRVKLEKGNKATDWTPAPEDTQAAIDKAQADANVSLAKTAGFTKIGDADFPEGLIFTSLIKLLDAGNDGDEMAGVSGIAGANKKDPAFWAGGNYGQAIGGLAKAIIRHDGTVKFTDAEITGTINAKNGTIEKLTMAPNGVIESNGGEIKFNHISTGISSYNTFGSTTESKYAYINGNPNAYTYRGYNFSVISNRKTIFASLSDWTKMVISNLYEILFKSPISGDLYGRYGYQYAALGSGHIILDGIVDGAAFDEVTFSNSYQVMPIRQPFHSNRITVNSGSYANCILVLPDISTLRAAVGVGVVSSRRDKFTFKITIINTGTNKVGIAGKNTINIGGSQVFNIEQYPLLYEYGQLRTTGSDVLVFDKRSKTFILTWDGTNYYAISEQHDN